MTNKNTTSTTLRHRKKAAGGGEVVDGSGTTTTTAVATTPVPSASASPSSPTTSSSSAFRVIPLKQTPWYARVDVAPFAVLYTIFIVSDLMLFSSSSTDSSPSEQEAQLVQQQKFLLSIALGFTLFIHLLVVIATAWSIRLQVLVGYNIVVTGGRNNNNNTSTTTTDCQQWTHAWVQSRSSTTTTGGESGIVPIIQQRFDDQDTLQLVIKFHECIFRYHQYSQHGTNHYDDWETRLWSLSTTTSSSSWSDHTTVPPNTFQPLRYPIDLPLSVLTQWQGHVTLDNVSRAYQLYGPNQMKVQLPSLVQLLGEQVLAPFFLFQVMCVILWSLDEYWYYALFTLVALVLFETTMAFHRLKSLQRLHDAGSQHDHQRVYVRRPTIPTPSTTSNNKQLHGSWMLVNKEEVVPGDYISLAANNGIQPTPVPADILLCTGTAVCDEALLTGESIPQTKHAMEFTEESLHANNNDNTTISTLDVQDALHKESILFGGTHVLVTHSANTSTSNHNTTSTSNETSSPPPPPYNGVCGIVLRTGFATTQGQLLRTLAYTSQKADPVHTYDTLLFILGLVILAFGAAGYVLHESWYDDRRNRFRLVLHVIMIVTSVVPPELPMELSLAVTNSFGALIRRAQVYCTEMYRIPWAGQVDLCCFDKTGTLTSDEVRTYF
jgi:cation-transporting ATPase 13A1